MHKTVCLIVAGGVSRRFGDPMPKQYQPLAGQPVLWHTIRKFYYHPNIDHVCVVIHPDHQSWYQPILEQFTDIMHTEGGKNRADSVYLGLKKLNQQQPTRILIHDAARPFVSHEIIDANINALKDAQAVLTYLEVTDTVRQQQHNQLSIINREELLLAQTPQTFDFPLLYDRYHHYQQNKESTIITDDFSLFKASKDKLAFVKGNRYNFKITTPEDLQLGEYLCQILQTSQ